MSLSILVATFWRGKMSYREGERMKRRLAERAMSSGAAMALAAGLFACVPGVAEYSVHEPHPARGAKATTENVREEVRPDVQASVDDDTIHVRVEQRTECGPVTRTPMETDSGTRRELKNGTLAQSANLTLAGLLVAGGIATYFAANSACMKTPGATSQNPSPASRPCTAEETDKQRLQVHALGIVVSSASIVPLGAFVWNLFRAKDDVTTAPSAPREDRATTTCGKKPAAHALVTIKAGSTTLTATTDENGVASIDMQRAARSIEDPRTASVTVSNEGRQGTTTVDLTGTPLFREWRTQRAEEEARKAQAQLERSSGSPSSCSDCLPWDCAERQCGVRSLRDLNGANQSRDHCLMLCARKEKACRARGCF